MGADSYGAAITAEHEESGKRQVFFFAIPLTP